ncbi:MAG: hypothetical protein ACI8XB_000409 [Patiriisocius sp.]
MLGAQNFSAQETAEIYGVVKDNNGGTIPSATITIEGLNLRTQSDVNGKYRFSVPAETEINLVASFADYVPFSRALFLNVNEEKKLNIRLVITELEAVDISRTRKDRVENMDPINARIANKVPSPNGGIEGVIKSQIGVKSNNELSSSYSVRGGNFDENLVYVNDIEVYRPFLARSGQQEGLSFPNPNLTSSILFSAGGFDAKYGDKMSSVLDIKYKRPISNEGSVLLSMLGGSVHYGSSAFNGRLRQITGLRYKTNQYLFGALETQGDYKPRFADLQSYWNYSFTDEWTVSFLGNYANNLYQFAPRSRQTNFGSINQALQLNVDFAGQERTAYETFFGALSADYVRKRMVLKFITSAFETAEEENFDIFGRYRIDELERDFGSEEFGEAVNNIGIGAYLNHARNTVNANVLSAEHKGYYNTDKDEWKWGLKFQKELIDDVLNEWQYVDSAGFNIPPVVDQGNDSTIILNGRINVSNSLESDRIVAFLQDSRKWLLGDNSDVTVTAGIRATHWTFNNETLLSPRGRISYAPKWIKVLNDSTFISRDLIIRASGGYYYQQPFYREMRNVFGEINPNIKAQRSIHALFGADMIVRMWDRPFKLVGEAYYKKYDQLIPYKVEGVRLRYFATNNSKGYAQGLDFKINGEFVPGVESWATVSYLKTEEDLTDDFFNTDFNASGEAIIPGFTSDQEIAYTETTFPGFIPRPTDQRISFSLFFQDELPMNPSYKVQLNLNYNSGLPFGPPGFDRYKDVERSKPYQRVDIGFTKELINSKNRASDSEKWYRGIKEAWVSLEVFNLLNINNAQSFTWFRATNGLQYSIPNNLTSRILNLKVYARF